MKVFALCFCLFFVFNIVISPTYALKRECTVQAICRSPTGIKGGWMTFVTQNDIANITTEVSLLKKNNAVMESEFDKLEKEAEKNKEKSDDETRQIKLFNEEVERMKKEFIESKAKMDDAMKQIKLLKKRNAAMEKKINKMEKNAADIAIKGVQGEMGPKGESGPIGLKGDDGPQGEVGQAGPKGDNGTRGIKGSKGEVGVIGPEGENGTQGEVGQPGPKGENGTRGKKGSNGKVGAKGEKGIKGGIDPKSEPASVDSLAIGNIIKVLCPVKHENKCFFPVIGREVDYDGGVAICESRLGAHLANIYSQSHMDDVMKYIRENQLGGSRWKIFCLGMIYDPKAKKLTLRDGTDAPGDLKWFPSYPRTVEADAGYADYTNVCLGVNSNQSSINQYLLNYTPSSTFYVLCELE